MTKTTGTNRKAEAPVSKGPTDSETVVSNTAFLLIGQVATAVLSLFLVLAVARYLGSVGLGSYSAAIALSALLMQVLDFGTPTLAIREIARLKEKASDFVSEMMGLRMVLSFAMLASGTAVFLALLLLGKITADTSQVMILAIIATALSFLAEPLRATLLAYEKHHFYAATWISERIVFVAFALAMLLAGKGMLMIMAGFASSGIFALSVNAFVVWKKFTRFSIRFDAGSSITLLKKGLPFWLSNLLMTVYSRIDTLMLSSMKGFAATGIYSAAYKITDLFTFIPQAVTTAFYPTLSRLFKNKDGMLQILYKRAFYYLILAAMPMAVSTTILSERIIRFLYRSGFEQASTALQILIWAEAFLFFNILMGYLLNSIDKQKLFTASTGAYAAVNILLNLIAIPKFGYGGAATVSLVTQGMQAATLYKLCSNSGYRLNLPKMAFKPLIATAIMGSSILLMRPLHLLIIAPTAGVIYGAMLVALGGLTKDDLTIAKGLISRIIKPKQRP